MYKHFIANKLNIICIIYTYVLHIIHTCIHVYVCLSM